MKKIITLFFSTIMFWVFVPVVLASIPTQVSISDLPEYLRTDNFKLGYTAISDDPASITAQFYYRKDGDSYQTFGGVQSGASGYIQVTGSQVSEQKKYYFKVEVNGVISDETSFTYDISGPDPVSGFRVEGLGGGTYKLYWRNPNTIDFQRVFIYRSDKSEFDANGGTKVGEMGGPKDTDMSWQDYGLDPNKTYYYAIRALDKAGNASGVVSNTPTVNTTTSTSPSTTGVVKILPKESGDNEGEVLAEKTSVTPTQAVVSPAGKEQSGQKNIFQKMIQFAKDRTKITVLILMGLAILGFASYKLLTKNKKDNK